MPTDTDTDTDTAPPSERLPGWVFLCLAVFAAGMFVFVVWMKGYVRDGQNFATEAWEPARIVELWWLWTTLPPCAALAALAAMRAAGVTRVAGTALAILTLLYALFVGHAFWLQWV